MKNIVIVGGGTAGWLTALYAKKTFPNDNVSVVQSKEIGILGAGEGTTPNLIALFDYLDIPVSELILKAKATIKTGIKFTNWSKKSNFYYHDFGKKFTLQDKDLIDYSISDFEIHKRTDLLHILQINKNTEPAFSSVYSEKNLVPFIYNDANKNSKNAIFNFNQLAQWSIHFDARLLAKLLEEIAVTRGIKNIFGTVKSINSTNNDNIDSIILDDETKIETDFIFDCTGFHKVFIGKHFKSEWVSFQESLPMKKAIPFFIDIDKDNIPAYTESTAMNYGWMWKIPLQHRYGCGYVYDSDFISDEDAKKEIENFLGFEPDYPKVDPFLFNPGCYKEIWKGNCLAVGLASAFVEPLEATSIFQTVTMLQSFFGNKPNIFKRNNGYIKNFNNEYLKNTEKIMDFIYLHYMTDKDNNDFWINFTKKNKIRKALEERVLLLNESVLVDDDLLVPFSSTSYYQVSFGINLLNLNNIKHVVNENNLSRFNKHVEKNELIMEELSDNFITHSNFLKFMGGLQD
jgi:tryptophan halogenase